MLIGKRASCTGPMDYTAVCRTGAQTLTYSTRSGMEILFRKNPIFFPAEKSVIFLCRKITYFSVWKNRVFLRAENTIIFVWKNRGFLYWPSGTGHWTGQRDSSGRWTVDRRTVQYRTMGHWTGHPVLDRCSPGPLDSGRWTVDSGRDRVDRSNVLTLEY